MQTTDTFTFNRDYNDLEQVADFLPRFEEVMAELTKAGKDRYNDSFKGRIPGIEGDDEDTAIYLLQGLERKRRQDERVAELLADGYVWMDSLEGRVRCDVALVPEGRMSGPFVEYTNVRVFANNGRPCGVLPKGARTRGYAVGERRVLAKVV